MADYILSHTADEVDYAIGEGLVPRPRLANVNDSLGTDVLYVTDPEGNVLVKFSDGHIKTKNFDSATFVGTLGNINAQLEGLL